MRRASSWIAVSTMLAALAVCLLAGCVPEPAPGQWGLFRYVGNVRGSAPLQLAPPISDRDGNAYVLYGAIDLLEARLFIGSRVGGWSGSCTVTFGNDFGVHGFVGRGQHRAWYWSGEALVVASGRSSGCERLLENDPSSGARLAFKAVVPWVRETSLRTTALAWIQAPTDPRPFQVVLDLDSNVYTSLEEFEPRDATNVAVLGVGGQVDAGEGMVLARYERGGSVYTVARFIDFEGKVIDEAGVGGLEMLPEYGVRGYFQSNDAGLYAGLDVEGQLVLLDHSGGQRTPVAGMTPAGVHRWEGKLYLVGDAGGAPKIAEIQDDGGIGNIRTWDASLEALDDLGAEIEVIDDRSLPSTEARWSAPRTAMGSFPFLHEHSLDHYADGTTTWLIAGPSFSAGGEDRTAIAYAPVGIAYEE
jgi:hypothetical protein